MEKQLKKDWSGFVINVEGQHDLIITGPWTQPDMWWWKCRNCFKSSGVMSTAELIRLDNKGIITPPDGNLELENSRHPKEQFRKHEDNEWQRYMYGWD